LPVNKQSEPNLYAFIFLPDSNNPIYSVTDEATICANELPYGWNGIIFTEAGTKNVTLQTINGCDSIVTMTLNVNPTYNVTDKATICETHLPYTWNGVVFTEGGSKEVTLPTINGCDSVITMTLTVRDTIIINQKSMNEVTYSFCHNDDNVILLYLTSGAPTHYQLIYDNAAVEQGFANVGYQSLASSNLIPIAIPSDCKEGHYTAILQLKDDASESEQFTIKFTINLSSKYIVKMWDDVVSGLTWIGFCISDQAI
jgi:hypothetical protein